MAEHEYIPTRRTAVTPVTPGTAIIIPFARAKAPPSTNTWADPASIDRLINEIEGYPADDLLLKAGISLGLANLTQRDNDVRLGCALKAMLCIARALDEAGFPVALAEAGA